MELVGKPMPKTVGDIISSFDPEDLDEVWIATAYLRKEGFNHIKNLITKVKTKIIVCLDPTNTDWEPLENMLESEFVECKYYKRQNDMYFHPKIYIFKHKNGRYSIIVGSSNLTQGGLNNNIEANLYLEKIDPDKASVFIEFFEKVFENAYSLNHSVVEDFKKTKDKYIEIQRLLEKEQKRRKRVIEYSLTERMLKSSEVLKVKRILQREKERYIRWLNKEQACIGREKYVRKIKIYVSQKAWERLFKELWSVGGLVKGPLAKYKNNPGIPRYLASINNHEDLQRWVAYIINGDWDKATRICNNLKYIGPCIQSELFCVYHGDRYGIMNDKSERALNYLIGKPEKIFDYKSYDSMPYNKFNSILKEILDIYLEVIGRRCRKIPPMLELDAFFWYLYENKDKLKNYQ